MRLVSALTGALLVATAMVGTAAQSAPVPAGPYFGEYFADNVFSGSNEHAFWTPSLGTGTSNYWRFEGQSGRVVWNGPLTPNVGEAQFTGRVHNLTNTNLQFLIDVTFTYISTGAPSGSSAPKCEYNSSVCNHADFVDAASKFEYFATTGTLTGAGDLAGFDLAVGTFPTNLAMPAQLGFGANNKPGGSSSLSVLDTFGLSSWLTLEVIANNGAIYPYAVGEMFDQANERGDFNLVLTPVPIPAALPLLLIGLAGLGLIGRRRQRAA